MNVFANRDVHGYVTKWSYVDKKTFLNEILQTFDIDLWNSEARYEMPTHRSICELNIVGHSHIL